VIIADTSGLLALFNRNEPHHAAVSAVVRQRNEPIAVSPFVVAELDYLAATRLGVSPELEIMRELAGGAYELPEITPPDLELCAEIIERYRDQEVGVADASLVVLAQRYRTRTILTLDHRHFDVLRPQDGGRFRLLPG
jgi:predicted nucleic acid-binding protein